MTNQENALKVIRYIQSNVEGLKELSFGCEIYIEGCEYPFKFISEEFKNGASVYNLLTESGNNTRVPRPGYIRIIGHEPQLNHLLLAMETVGYLKIMGLTRHELGLSFHNSSSIISYDLTKTVQKNLKSNPELCNYCLTLFGL